MRPGCGAIVAMLETATGLSAFSVGKPSPVMMRMARKELGLATAETTIIGDTMETDILGGVQMGYRTVLVLSGGTRREDLARYAYRPDVVVNSIADLCGLDPQLVLGLIEVESGFRKYAVSTAGARGFMQVMPFWTSVFKRPRDNLFSLRTNLRYGCVILRYYLNLERGDYFRALGRYNGSLGRPEYPNAVHAHWRGRWKYDGPTG